MTKSVFSPFFFFFLPVLCFLFPGELSAQNKTQDPWLNKIHALENGPRNVITDTMLINAYVSVLGDPMKLEYIKRIIDISTFNLQKPIASDELRTWFLEEQGIGTGYLGGYYDDLGNNQKALVFYFIALRMHERSNYKYGMLCMLNNIAVISGNLRDHKKALQYHYKALALAKSSHFPEEERVIYGNIGAEYSEMNNFEMALRYFTMSMQASAEAKDTAAISRALGNIGMTYKDRADRQLTMGIDPRTTSDYDTAVIYLKKAFGYNGITGNTTTSAAILSSLGSVYISTKKYTEAKAVLFQSLALAEELDNLSDIMETDSQISLLYTALGDTEQAFEHYKKYIAAKDSIFNEANTKKNVETEMNYEFDKKEATQKAEHEKVVIGLEAQNRIQKNTRNFIIVLAAMLLLLVAAGFMFYNNRKSLKLREQYSQQLLISQETEKQRISKELHDSIGQNILFIRNQLVKNNDHSLMASVDETLEEVRNLSKDLYPNQLEKYGLIAAVEGLSEKVKAGSDIFMSHDLEAFDKSISPDKLINYYRIIQECVTNVLKHADAKALRISATKLSNAIELIIQDNGKGFDKLIMAKRSQRSFGLLNLEERVNYLKGSFELETAPGKGTKYIFILPF
jgi:signal transduction histidine kinase